MELEYEDHSKRRKILIVAGVVLALVAGGAAFFLLSQAQARGTAEVKTVDVIVAARDVPARTALAASDLTTMAVPVSTALGQALTDPAQVVGRVTAVAIFAQQPITPNLLASSTAGTDFSILAPTETIAPDSPAWRAVAVNVPDDRAVGGALQDGQHVDVFVTVQVNVQSETGQLSAPVPVDPAPADDDEAAPEGEEESTEGGQESTEGGQAEEEPAPNAAPAVDDGAAAPYYTDKSTKITYQDVPILKKNGTMYILRVDAKTAEEINHLAASGTAAFSFALRSEGDDRAVAAEEYGETTNRIIEQYGLPIPEVYPKP